MLKFFVKDEVYKDRLAICKACAYYFSPTGQCKRCLCFMRIKAKIGHMECPQKYWEKTTEVEQPDDLPQEIIDEIIEIYPDVKTGRAKNQDVKKKMIELYNTIYQTNYSTGTSCGSCLSTCLDGIIKLYEKYTQ
jgi:NAD-dependent dihydropyrimidine dehydrogenase PreA subunit